MYFILGKCFLFANLENCINKILFFSCFLQEYDRHLGAVNSITFVDENRRFVSTSDDKSLRVWEWDIPVDMKYIGKASV